MRELAGPGSLGLSCYAAVTMATAMSATHALPKKTGIPCASHRTRLEHSPTDPRHLMRPRAGEAPTASVAYTGPTRLRMSGWPRAVRVRPDARGVGEVGAQFPDVFEASIDTSRLAVYTRRPTKGGHRPSQCGTRGSPLVQRWVGRGGLTPSRSARGGRSVRKLAP
jgi:hypothetical protein